jgi:type IV secretory pathway VirB3-like protein
MIEPIFKGATRATTFAGIPLLPFFFSCLPVVILAMLFSLWLFALLIPVYIGMRLILASDSKYFTELQARLSFLLDGGF